MDESTFCGGHLNNRHTVQTAQKNATLYDWALKKRTQTIEKADHLFEKEPAFYWHAVESARLPRNIHTNFEIECPVCLTQTVQKYGVYAWICHTKDHDWKIECPNCHFIFPSNDFAAYRKSGLDQNGFFDPALADRSLLVNTLYPDKDPHWCVDDGFGWYDEKKRGWAFVAYYHHFGIWMQLDPSKGESLILSTLDTLTQAFAITGTLCYAQLGLMILDRIADVYPCMHLSDFADWKPFYNNDGGTGKGKIAGCISEPGIVQIFLKAIDAFLPVLEQTRTPDMINEILLKNRLSLPERTSDSIRTNLLQNIVRQVYPGIQKREIFGNTGMHHNALAMAAVVRGKSLEADEWIDWVFRSDEPLKDSTDENCDLVRGGNLLPLLINQVDRDGFGDEVSYSYNKIWLDTFTSIAQTLNAYQGLDRRYHLINHPKYIKMVTSYIPLVIHHEYLPHHGDAGRCQNPGTDSLLQTFVTVYRLIPTPELAYAIYRLNQNRTSGLFEDIFLDDPQKWEQELTNAAKKMNNPNRYGTALPDYGFAWISVNKPDTDTKNRTALTIYFGKNTGHGHFDTLTIGYYNHRLDLIPDLGYPEYTDAFNRRRKEWEHNTVSHNTVVIEQSQEPHQGGSLLCYGVGEQAGFLHAQASDAYSNSSRYDRKIACVAAFNGASYVIDCFGVDTPGECTYLLHGASKKSDVLGQANIQTLPGTYMGEDVEYEKDPSVDPNRPYESYRGSGFHYLKDVKRITASSYTDLILRQRIEDTWHVYGEQTPNVFLSIRSLCEIDRMHLAKSIPPRNKPGNPTSLETVILSKSEPNRFTFITCLSTSNLQERDCIKQISIPQYEPIEHVPKDVPYEMHVRKIELFDQTIDYILLSDHENSCVLVEKKLWLSGRFCLVRTKKGRVMYVQTETGCLVGEKSNPAIRRTVGAIHGTIDDMTKTLSTSNTLHLRPDPFDYEGPIWPTHDFGTFHRYIHIRSRHGNTHAFRIYGIKQQKDLLIVDLDNQTPITRLHKNGRYETAFSIGDRAVIPIGYTKTL